MNWNYESNKQIYISFDGGTITNNDVVADSFSLTERICTYEQLELGTCEASELRLTVSNDFGRLKGKELTVSFYTDGDSTNKYQVGKYTVISDKAIEHSTKREIVAYDAMYGLSQKDISEWYNTKAFTNGERLLSQFAQLLGTELNLTVTIPERFATHYVFQSMEKSAALMATDVLRALGEIVGGSYHIGRNGSLEFIDFSNLHTGKTYELHDVIDASYEEYEVKPVSRVRIQSTSNGIEYESGEGNNIYSICGNMLLPEKGLVTEGLFYAALLRGGLEGLTYTPFDVEVVGNPEVKVGDVVTVPCSDGTSVTSIIFERTLSGINGMRDTFRSSGEETRESDTSIVSQIKSIGNTTSELYQDVNGVLSRVSDIEDDYVKQSTYDQDSESINMKVEELNRELDLVVDQLDGEVESYNVTEEPTFQKNEDDTLAEANYPAITFTRNIYVHPTESIIIDRDIPFLYTDEYLKQHMRELATDTESNLSYRFVKESGAYGWKPVADGDYSLVLSRVATLEISSGKIEQRVGVVEKTSSANSKSITTMEGTLKTQADKIEAKVSKKEGDATTSCSWDLSSDAFKVNSNGVEVLKVDGNGLNIKGSGTFTGAITSNSANITGGSLKVGNNFEVNNQGIVTARNIKITGGTYSVGTIGGTYFGVDASGTLFAQNATLKNVTLNGGGAHTLYVDDDGVTAKGTMYAEEILIGDQRDKVLTEADTEWETHTLDIFNGHSEKFLIGHNGVLEEKWKTLVLEGYAKPNTPYQTLTIPFKTITKDERQFGISWGSDTLIAKVSILTVEYVPPSQRVPGVTYDDPGDYLKFECVGTNSFAKWTNAYLQK